jgi:hypothetical protein
MCFGLDLAEVLLEEVIEFEGMVMLIGDERGKLEELERVEELLVVRRWRCRWGSLRWPEAIERWRMREIT